nr:DUF6056 family protein [Bifidobacterium colobi]
MHDVERLRKVNESKYWIAATWVCSIVVTFITLLPIGREKGDDTNFAIWISQSSSPAHWVWERYLNWSGRVFSESAAAVFIPLDQMWWRIADALMVALLVYSIIRLVSDTMTVSAVLMGYAGIWLLPPQMMKNAVYWVAGSFAYLWPSALALFSAILLMDIYKGKPTRYWGWRIPLVFLASLGVEQTGLCLCAFGAVTVLVVWLRQKTVSVPALVFTVVAAIGVVIELVSPGSHLRTISEANYWYKEFPTLSVSRKVVRGVIWQTYSTTKYLLPIIAVMAIGLLVAMARDLKRSESIELEGMSARTSAVVVNCMCVLTAMLVMIMCLDATGTRKMLMHFYGGGPRIIIAYLFWGVLFTAWALIVVLYSHSPKFTALMLLACIAATAVMYFSPTIYASGVRSMFASSLMLIMLIHIARLEHPHRFWYWIIGLPAALNFVHFVLGLWGASL